MYFISLIPSSDRLLHVCALWLGDAALLSTVVVVVGSTVAVLGWCSWRRSVSHRRIVVPCVVVVTVPGVVVVVARLWWGAGVVSVGRHGGVGCLVTALTLAAAGGDAAGRIVSLRLCV